MNSVTIPAPLHDLFGARQVPGAIALVAAAGVALPLALGVADQGPFGGVATWRSVLAVILIADIAAGVVANFTAGTNDHYATRPRSRWLFIAVHVHLPLVALLLDAPLVPAMVLWAATIAAATIVNLLAGRPSQRTVAGLLLAVILTAIPLLPVTPALAAVAAVFALKVVYAFAVDHRPGQPRVT